MMQFVDFIWWDGLILYSLELLVVLEKHMPLVSYFDYFICPFVLFN